MRPAIVRTAADALRQALTPEALERQGLTSRDAARLVGVGPSDLSRFIKGRQNFSRETLRRASQVFLESTPGTRPGFVEAREFLGQGMAWRAARMTLSASVGEGRIALRRLVEDARPLLEGEPPPLLLRSAWPARLQLLGGPPDPDLVTGRAETGERLIALAFGGWPEGARLALALEGELEPGGAIEVLPELLLAELEITVTGAPPSARPFARWPLGGWPIELACADFTFEVLDGLARFHVASPLPGLTFGVALEPEP